MKTFMDDMELTRRRFDVSCILSDTLLMCDNKGQMGGAKIRNVKVKQAVGGGTKESPKVRHAKWNG